MRPRRLGRSLPEIYIVNRSSGTSMVMVGTATSACPRRCGHVLNSDGPTKGGAPRARSVIFATVARYQSSDLFVSASLELFYEQRKPPGEDSQGHLTPSLVWPPHRPLHFHSRQFSRPASRTAPLRTAPSRAARTRSTRSPGRRGTVFDLFF